MILGIDVSENNGYVDWQAVADAGVKFAFIRCSYGKSSEDEYFRRNVDAAHEVGIMCGAYVYSYALTPEAARIEAQFAKEVIENAGCLLELPVMFDMEDADGYKRRHDFDFSAENITAICSAFLEEIAPLDCGVYASESWLNDYIDWQGLGCAVWNAAWVNGAQYGLPASTNNDGIGGYCWQFTDQLIINGKQFDGNILYVD
jgi:GH25 family lysozyme M1 (1,4-beta-N-acetylmuramidase)